MSGAQLEKNALESWHQVQSWGEMHWSRGIRSRAGKKCTGATVSPGGPGALSSLPPFWGHKGLQECSIEGWFCNITVETELKDGSAFVLLDSGVVFATNMRCAFANGCLC